MPVASAPCLRGLPECISAAGTNFIAQNVGGPEHCCISARLCHLRMAMCECMHVDALRWRWRRLQGGEACARVRSMLSLCCGCCCFNGLLRIARRVLNLAFPCCRHLGCWHRCRVIGGFRSVACSVLVCFFCGGCSAGGVAGTGSALGYDCHDLQCACHQTRCVARAVVATSSCNLGITGTGTPVMVLALAPVPVPVLILVH